MYCFYKMYLSGLRGIVEHQPSLYYCNLDHVYFIEHVGDLKIENDQKMLFYSFSRFIPCKKIKIYLFMDYCIVSLNLFIRLKRKVEMRFSMSCFSSQV